MDSFSARWFWSSLLPDLNTIVVKSYLAGQQVARPKYHDPQTLCTPAITPENLAEAGDSHLWN